MTTNLNYSLILSLLYVFVWIFLFGDAEGKGGGGGYRGYGGGGGGGLFSALSGFIILILVSIFCGGCCGFFGCAYWLGSSNEKKEKKDIEAEKQSDRDAR